LRKSAQTIENKGRECEKRAAIEIKSAQENENTTFTCPGRQATEEQRAQRRRKSRMGDARG